MESQEDSIDIFRLKRVALGLEYEPSQPHAGVYAIAAANSQESLPIPSPKSHGRSSSQGMQQPAGSDELAESVNPPDDSSRTNLPRTSQSSPSPQSAMGLIDPPPAPSIPSQPKNISGSQAGNMSSADAAPGDTQVVSQSVYDSIIRQNKVFVQHGESEYSGGTDNGADGATLATLHEGDTGHIDLLSGFEDAQPDTNNVDDNEDTSSFKLGESSPLHYQPNLFPESQRFLTTTPATAMKQSNTEGLSTVTPSVSRNPLASNIESSGGIMALSQVFKATQAPSSPLVNGLQSDLPSDRPSPNIPIQSRSLATGLSSPFMSLPSTLPRETSDPQLAYITMKESQAVRNRRMGERMTRSADNINSEDLSDGEFNKEPSFVERLRRQKMIDEEARAQFAGLTAPARPTSNRRGKQSQSEGTSPRGKHQGNDRSDTTVVYVLDDDTQEPNTVPTGGGTSEEETEQEEDLDPLVPLSEAHQSSTEEDKENFNSPALPALVAATSAHGRLSQALALDESPSARSRASAKEHRQKSHSPSRSERGDELNRSSQVFVVKDSQQSPGPKGTEDSEEGLTNQRWSQQPRFPYCRLQVESSSDLEKVTSSPVLKAPQSSPPSSRVQQDQQPSELENNGISHNVGTHNRSASDSSNDSASRLPRNISSCEDTRAKAGNIASQRSIDISDRLSGLEPRKESSSMPSHVAETPVHQHPRDFGEGVPMTSVPETSPRRSQTEDWANDTNGDMPNQEDDDLPPLHPAARDTASQTRPSGSLRFSPPKAFYNPKILSSPSGRQRRALTEIAADASPQAGPGAFDVDIGLFTAEDREFTSLIGMSPIPPRKKRRGNDGQNIYASDPIFPVTPRSATPRSVRHIQESEGLPEEPQSMELGDDSSRRQRKPSRRTDTLWDVEDSPEQPVSRRARLNMSTTFRGRERQPSPVKKTGKAVVAKSVVPRNDRSTDSTKDAENTGPEQRSRAVDSNFAVTRPGSSDNVKIALNQVLAPWSGPKRAYYPATCFGTPIGTSQSRYVVKFEDSPPIEVPVGSVKRLELRVGDAVKVDMPNVPKVTHIVRGFVDKVSAEELSRQTATGLMPVTDVYGHSTVVLGPKQRKSLPSGGLSGPEHTIQVPISRIYLDTILWNQLKDRGFTLETSHSEFRFQTPSDRHSTPTSPGTRLSRSMNFLGGIFAGMVFAVSYVENEDAKSRVTRLILENDGRILKDGFNELFEFPSTLPLASPTRSSTSGATNSHDPFRLTKTAEDVGFACLIADQHSRREKYMQALALNLPCLSGRWIEDCVAQNRILDWEMYLLPAGESMYLNGATKSRILTPSPATAARLPYTITARPKLLDGQSVLLVMGRGKAEEKRKAYIFLTYALGAARVERVLDLRTAKAVLDQETESGDSPGWDWIYVDDYEEAAARAMLLGAAAPGSQNLKTQSFRAGKKRKRSELMESINGSELGQNGKIRIVGNEFVCQSLILGRLFEE